MLRDNLTEEEREKRRETETRARANGDVLAAALVTSQTLGRKKERKRCFYFSILFSLFPFSIGRHQWLLLQQQVLPPSSSNSNV